MKMMMMVGNIHCMKSFLIRSQKVLVCTTGSSGLNFYSPCITTTTTREQRIANDDFMPKFVRFNSTTTSFIASASTTTSRNHNVLPPSSSSSSAPLRNDSNNRDDLSTLSTVEEMRKIIDSTIPSQRAQTIFDTTIESLCFKRRMNDAKELYARVNKYRTRTWFAAIQIIKSMFYHRESDENVKLFLKDLTPPRHNHTYLNSMLRLLHKKPDIIAFWFNELFGDKGSLLKYQDSKSSNHSMLINCFLHQFFKCGMHEMCDRAFNLIENPNNFAHVIAIQVECEKQMDLARENSKDARIDLTRVCELLANLKQIEDPDVRTYTTILRTFSIFPDNDHNVNSLVSFFTDHIPGHLKNDLSIAAFIFPAISKWRHDRVDEFIKELIPTLNLTDEAIALRLLGSIGRCNKDHYVHIFLQRMEECNIEIGVKSLNVIMKYFFHQGNFESAQHFFQTLTRTYKIQPDSETSNVLTKYFVDNTRSNYAISKEIDVREELKRAERYISKMGPLSQTSCKILISAYLDFNCENEALELLNHNVSLVNPHIISSFAHFYCSHDRIDEALNFMDLFRSRGVEPTGYTQEIIAKAYLKSYKFDEAHEQIKVVMKSDTIELLDKLALLDSAKRIFKDEQQEEYAAYWKQYKQEMVNNNKEMILRAKKKGNSNKLSATSEEAAAEPSE